MKSEEKEILKKFLGRYIFFCSNLTYNFYPFIFFVQFLFPSCASKVLFFLCCPDLPDGLPHRIYTTAALASSSHFVSLPTPYVWFWKKKKLNGKNSNEENEPNLQKAQHARKKIYIHDKNGSETWNLDK